MRFSCTPGETFGNDLETYEPPFILLPPHVSPLGMLYYDGDMFREELGGKLLIAWHGHEAPGHRLAAYAVDERGLPALTFDANQPSLANRRAEVVYHMDGDLRPHPFYRFATSPPGTFLRGAQHVEVVASMYKSPGVRPLGQIVGIAVDGEGAIWAAADKKGNAIFRIARPDADSTPDIAPEEDEGGVYARSLKLLRDSNAHAYDTILAKFGRVFESSIHRSCAGCHGIPAASSAHELELSALSAIYFDFVGSSEWLVPGAANRSSLVTRVLSRQLDRMPPAGSRNPDISPDTTTDVIVPYINDMMSHFSNTGIRISATNVKVRSAPLVSSETECGMALATGDVVYVHESRSAGNVLWARVSLERKRRVALRGGCAEPEQELFVAQRSLGGSTVYLHELTPESFLSE